MDITQKITELAEKHNTSFEYVRDLYCDLDLDLTWKELLCALSWGNPYEYVRTYLSHNYHEVDGVMIRKDYEEINKPILGLIPSGEIVMPVLKTASTFGKVFNRPTPPRDRTY